MPPDQISTIIERIDGLKALMLEKFQQNEEDHQAVKEHLTKLNGQVAKNSEARVQQDTHNRWMKAIVVSLILPTAFLLLKSFI